MTRDNVYFRKVISKLANNVKIQYNKAKIINCKKMG